MFAFGFIVGLAVGLAALVAYVIYHNKVVAALQGQLATASKIVGKA